MGDYVDVTHNRSRHCLYRMGRMALERRTLLTVAGSTVCSLTAGCVNTAVQNRSLSLRLINIRNTSDGEYKMSVEVLGGGVGKSDEWATFHNVSLVGYSESGDLVCEKSLGTLGPNASPHTVNVTCSGFPEVSTFRAAESPCDEDTQIVKTIEDDFGIMIARDEFRPGDFQRLQSVGMHELGHALSIGWRDDAPIPGLGAIVGQNAYEVYSGNTDPDLTGGVDETPERINIRTSPNPIQEWSVMRSGTARDIRSFTPYSPNAPTLLFGIEEMSTVDFEDIPSRSDS